MGQSHRLLACGALFVTATLVGALIVALATSHQRELGRQRLALDAGSGWTEIGWPHIPDPWWPSTAFSCSATICGKPLTLYLRVKVGFCNCTEGIADDKELERIGDFLVLSRRHQPVSDGRAIALGGLAGRARPYSLVVLGRSGRSVSGLMIGLNHRCDAVVATAVHDAETTDLAPTERAVSEFIESAEVQRWTRTALGL